MVIETSCSQGPPVSVPAEPRPIITRIVTNDGTVYVTSNYTVQDSVLVIREILRGKKYYPDPDEPHLYQKPDPVKQPPSDTQTPVVLSHHEISSIDTWQPSHPGYGIGGFALVVAGVALVFAIMWSQMQWDIN